MPGGPDAILDWDLVVGYADRLSALPGERLQLMVSAAGPLETRVIRLPGGADAAIAVEHVCAPAPQAVRTGSHVRVEDDERLRPADGLAVSTWVWLAPGWQGGRRHALIATNAYTLALGPGGRAGFEVRTTAGTAKVETTAPLPLDTWVRVEGAFDPDAGAISVAAGGRSEVAASGRLDPTPGPLLLGAAPGAGGEATDHLDGKLDQPRIDAGTPEARRMVAGWDLGAGRGPEVADTGPHGLTGRCVNGPYRAVTGAEWDGSVHDWRFAERGYSAMRFHADATDDLGWAPSLALTVPDDCEGGVYAVVLSCNGSEDVVPFVVRRAPRAEARPLAVLLPTFTYQAYSCERGAPALAASERAEDRWAAENRLLSLYDRHEDGGGAYEASLLRPLTQLRPSYRCAQHGGPHGLAQDLILLGFLERRGIEVDLLTDHDVHDEGAAAFAGHRVLITGAHPEYATAELRDALDSHVAGGGHLAYLGGNGLQGVVSVDPERPAVIEVRRNDTQALCWQADAGEHHHAATGLFGGDWRRHGRPERALLGVALSGFGDGPAAAYGRRVGPGDVAGDAIFAGLEPDEAIDAGGVVLGGPAGYEVDGADLRTGSPPETKVLAASRELAGYEPWPDDVVDDADEKPPAIRAEMTLHGGDGRGYVFATGSIAWTGCLGEDDNPVARVTENALRELASDRPFSRSG